MGAACSLGPCSPQCRGTIPVPPDCERLAELTQDLAQQRQELVGGEEAQVPLMEPIHFEKVSGPGSWAQSAPGVGGCQSMWDTNVPVRR